MFGKGNGFSGQTNYNEGNNIVSLHWYYVYDRHNYHIRVLIQGKAVWFDFIGVFCRVSFQICMDIYYC